MRLILSLIFLLLSSLISLANNKIEAVKNASHDTIRASILISWGEQIYLHKPDSALILFKKAAQITQQALVPKSLSDEKEMKVRKEKLAEALNNIGFIYSNQGNIQMALEYYSKCLKIQEQISHKVGIAMSYNNIAVIYNGQGEIEKALEYFQESLKIRKEINDKFGIAMSLNNIGLIYQNHGQLDKGLEYNYKSLKIREEINDKLGMATNLNNIGAIYHFQGKFELGLEHYNKSLMIRKEIGDEGGISVTLNNIAKLHLKMRNINKALSFGQQSLKIAKHIGYPDEIKSAAILLNQIYRSKKQWKDAFEMYELFIQMRDSIYNEETQKATIRQQMKYEYKKSQLIKEQQEKEEARIEAEITSRRNNIHYTAIFIGLLLVFGVVLALGFLKVSPKTAEGIIFFSFLILFEFILVLADPYIENLTGGAPGYKLVFNALLAGCIFPLHQFFEGKLKNRLIKVERKKWHKGIKPLMIAILVISHTNIFSQTDSAIQNQSRNHLITQSQNIIDSLRTNYQNATHDITKVNSLLGLANAFYLTNPDTTLTFCEQAMLISESASLHEELAACYGWIAYLVQQKGNIPKALEYNFKSVKIFEKFLSENVSEGLFSEEQKIVLNKNNLFKKRLATVYNNIGTIYNDQGEIEKALEYYFLSLNIKEQIKNKKGMAESYNNIGVIYYNQAEMKKALEYFLLTLEIDEEIKNKKGMAQSYHNIGNALCKLDSLEEGMRSLELGLGLAKELGYQARISDDYSAIGGWQLKLGQVEAAQESGLEALALAKEVGHVEYIKKAARLLSDVHQKQGKFEDALAMYELEIGMRDSIVNEENQKQLIRQQMKYDYEKKKIIKEQAEKEKARIEAEVTARRDELHYTGIVIAIFVIGLLVAMIGFIKVSQGAAEGIIFIAFLILFEFLLVLFDPYVDDWTGGAPGWKLISNVVLAAIIFPLHGFFEKRVKTRIMKNK